MERLFVARAMIDDDGNGRHDGVFLEEVEGQEGDSMHKTPAAAPP